MGRTRGGTRVGEGRTGLVFNPPIPCKGEPGPRKGFVTRVPKADLVDPVDLPPEDWKVNSEILTKLQTLDPDQRYFFYPVACEPGDLTAENKADGLTEAQKPYAELVRYAPKGTWANPQYRGRTWGEWMQGRKDLVLESTAPRTQVQKDHLTEAVARLHQSGMIHGDLRPSNIVLAEDDLPRLIDFEFARLGASEQDIRDEDDRLQRILQGKLVLSSVPREGRRKTLRRKKQWSRSRSRSVGFNRRRLGTRR